MTNELNWLKIAREYIGQKEINGTKHNPIIVQLWKLAFEATKQPMPAVFTNDETPWCGGFVVVCWRNLDWVSISQKVLPWHALG